MTSAMPETTPVTEMGIEPLTDAETESAFFTLIGILDKLNCAPAATVGAKDGRGVTFSLHFSTDRVRRLLDARAALSTRTPEAAQVETVISDAEFLCARVRELEGDLEDGHTARQYFGHVIPALARMEAALAQVRHPLEKEG